MDTNNIYTNNDEGISFLDVLKTCWKYKILIVAITLAITLIGTLFIQFFFDKRNSVYKSTVTINYSALPIVTDADRNFNFSSKEVLEVLEKKGEYKKFDFETVYKSFNPDEVVESGYNVAIVPQETSAETATAKNITNVTYTIEMSREYFTDRKQAVQFVKDLTNIALNAVGQKIVSIDNGIYFAEYSESVSYDQQIDALKKQQEVVLEKYNGLTSAEKIGGNYIVNGTSLENRVKLLNEYNAKLTQLENYVYQLGCVKMDNPEKVKSYAENMKIVLEGSQVSLQKQISTISELQSSATDPTETARYAREKTALEKELVQLQPRIDYLASVVTAINGSTAVADASVENAIKTYATELQQFTAQYSDDVSAIYTQTSGVSYEDKQKVVEEGSLGLVKGILLSFIIGFVLSLATVYFVNMIAKDKKRQATFAQNATTDKE